MICRMPVGITKIGDLRLRFDCRGGTEAVQSLGITLTVHVLGLDMIPDGSLIASVWPII